MQLKACTVQYAPACFIALTKIGYLCVHIIHMLYITEVIFFIILLIKIKFHVMTSYAYAIMHAYRNTSAHTKKKLKCIHFARFYANTKKSNCKHKMLQN